jgi:diaminobutyrate-2-oxoglutarate transaminase
LARKSGQLSTRLTEISALLPEETLVKGRGMMQGIVFADAADAAAVSREAFRRGMIIETAGPRDEVVKVLCPLTISDEDLERGLTILEDAVRERIVTRRQAARAASRAG